MSKELEYIQRQKEIVEQQVKGSNIKIIVTDTVTKHQYDYYERELQTLESIEKALQRLDTLEKGKNADIIDNYMGFKNDNAEPSEALECLEFICKILNEKRIDVKWLFKNEYNTIKQALLKAQEPKQYLKWEDLEFKEKRQTIKVRMGNTIYNLFFYEFDTGYKRCHLCNEEETLIYDIQEQLFNDLHLERVEE